MTLLKDSDILDTYTAYVQASLALFDLRPFTSAPGIVLTGKKLQKTREDEPIATYQAAKDLQAKAYFRLGSAKFLVGEYETAMQMFERCLAATKDIYPDRKPDRVVVNRLAESTRLFANQKKKRRKKFKSALQGADDT
jgi:tetratricopeptide (TPR) repeat protein